MREIWKTIPSFSKYQASNLGNIRSIKNKHIISQALSSNGRMYCGLHADSKERKRCQVHRLILAAFRGVSKLPCDHINENPIDNRLCNLRYVTARVNNYTYHRRRSAVVGSNGRTLKNGQKRWMAEIIICKKRKYIGYYDTPYKAHQAYIRAKKKCEEHGDEYCFHNWKTVVEQVRGKKRWARVK